jgi:hypothetical protein
MPSNGDFLYQILRKLLVKYGQQGINEFKSLRNSWLLLRRFFDDTRVSSKKFVKFSSVEFRENPKAGRQTDRRVDGRGLRRETFFVAS